MADTKARGGMRLTSPNSEINALTLFVNQMISAKVNTAEVVRVVNVIEATGAKFAPGYVDVIPLVCQIDGWGNAIKQAVIYRLPYSRIQGGVAALVIDPVPGDIGIAIFMKRDSSNVNTHTKEPIQPASFRSFDMADGFYIGGFMNKPPDIFLELKQDGDAILTAPQSVTVNTFFCQINTDKDFGGIELIGDVFIDGNLSVSQTTTSNQIKTKDGVDMNTHTHSGVDAGSGNSGPPNAGENNG